MLLPYEKNPQTIFHHKIKPRSLQHSAHSFLFCFISSFLPLNHSTPGHTGLPKGLRDCGGHFHSGATASVIVGLECPFPRSLFSWVSDFLCLIEVHLLREALPIHSVSNRNITSLFTIKLLHCFPHSAYPNMLLLQRNSLLCPLSFFLIRPISWGHWPFCSFSATVDIQY